MPRTAALIDRNPCTRRYAPHRRLRLERQQHRRRRQRQRRRRRQRRRHVRRDARRQQRPGDDAPARHAARLRLPRPRRLRRRLHRPGELRPVHRERDAAGAHALSARPARCVRSECFPHPDGGAAPCTAARAAAALRRPRAPHCQADSIKMSRHLRRRHHLLRHLLHGVRRLRGRHAVIAPASAHPPLARSRTTPRATGRRFSFAAASARAATAPPCTRSRRARSRRRCRGSSGGADRPSTRRATARAARTSQKNAPPRAPSEHRVAVAPGVDQRQRRVGAVQRGERRAHQQRASRCPTSPAARR